MVAGMDDPGTVLSLAWTLEAACLGCPPELFFPSRGEPSKDAQAVCAGCPVQQECLEYAIVTGRRHGVWGGRSGKDLREMRRRLSGRRGAVVPDAA